MMHINTSTFTMGYMPVQFTPWAIAMPEICVVYDWPTEPALMKAPEVPGQRQQGVEDMDMDETAQAEAPNAAAAAAEPEVVEQPQRETPFESAYKYALALCTKGNNLARDKHYKVAVREYDEAVQQIEFVKLSNFHEHGLQQKLLLRLYTNLAVCYMNLDDPKMCCTNCNKIYLMCRGSNLVVPWKVYYNNAKALIVLRDLTTAEKRLRNADSVNPGSAEIARLFVKLQKLKANKKERDRRSAVDLGEEEEALTPNHNFRNAFHEMCKEFMQCPNRICELPGSLVATEKEYVNKEAGKWGFNVFFTKSPKVEKVVLCKRAGL